MVFHSGERPYNSYLLSNCVLSLIFISSLFSPVKYDAFKNLFNLENVLVEEVVQVLIGIVNAQLFKAVLPIQSTLGQGYGKKKTCKT